MFSQTSLKQLALLSLTVFSSGVAAAPPPRICNGNGPIGQIRDKLDGPWGNQFCSSYLSIMPTTTTLTNTKTKKSTTFVTTVSKTKTIINTTIGTVVTAPTVVADATTTTLPDPDTTVTSCSTDPLTISTPTVPSVGTDALSKRAFPTKSYQPAQISKACKCLHLPTPTETSTTVTTTTETISKTKYAKSTTITSTIVHSTTTPTHTPTSTTYTTSTTEACPAATPDTSCDNSGLEWAYYESNSPPFSDDDWTAYDPTVFETMTSGAEGTTDVVGFPASSAAQFTPYDSTDSFSTEEAAIEYHGYLYAPKSGDYTFTLSGADDIVFVWAGEVAVADWTRDNALLYATWYQNGGAKQDKLDTVNQQTHAAVGGTYIPIRIIWNNKSGEWGFSLTVTDPEDNIILSQDVGDFTVNSICSAGPILLPQKKVKQSAA